MLETVAVRSSKDLDRFVKLPFMLYRHDPNWVPPLIGEQKKFFDPSKNPYFEHSEVQLFLLFKNGKPAGRISAHTNTQHNKFHDDKVGFFGFFECIDDQEAASKLIDTATEWIRSRELEILRGPADFSTNDECGLLIDGFDSPPFILMNHNHPYYLKLLEGAGLKKSMDLYAYLIPRKETPERLVRIMEKLQKRGRFTVREIGSSRKAKKKDLKTVFTVYAKAWERNWGFVPMTRKEFDHLIDSVFDLIRPEFVYLAFVDNEPAGFYAALPDYNQLLMKAKGHLFPFGFLHFLFGRNSITRIRIVTMGVIKEFQNRGIDTVFYTKNFINVNEHKKLNIREAELSWVLENNTMMNRIAKNLGGKVHKTYRILDKKIV